MNNVSFSRDRAFVARILSISLVAGLMTGLWVSAAQAKETSKPDYQVPGHCVKTTEINDDGSIVTRWSCEYTVEQARCLKQTGKLTCGK